VCAVLLFPGGVRCIEFCMSFLCDMTYSFIRHVVLISSSFDKSIPCAVLLFLGVEVPCILRCIVYVCVYACHDAHVWCMCVCVCKRVMTHMHCVLCMRVMMHMRDMPHGYV